MLDEDDQPVERLVPDQQTEKEPVKISYLYIPPGKTFRSFWIWVPDYTADAINAWKRERAPEQRQRLD